jgi:hypothetical protein
LSSNLGELFLQKGIKLLHKKTSKFGVVAKILSEEKETPKGKTTFYSVMLRGHSSTFTGERELSDVLSLTKQGDFVEMEVAGHSEDAVAITSFENYTIIAQNPKTTC